MPNILYTTVPLQSRVLDWWEAFQCHSLGSCGSGFESRKAVMKEAS